jgi:NTE family protein
MGSPESENNMPTPSTERTASNTELTEKEQPELCNSQEVGSDAGSTDASLLDPEKAGPAPELGTESIGLALSADDAQGAYQLGAWKALQELGIQFAALSGSAVGALNAALISQGSWEEAFQLWLETAKVGAIATDYAKLWKAAFRWATQVARLTAPVPDMKAFPPPERLLAMMRFFQSPRALRRFARTGIMDPSGVRSVMGRHLDMSRLLKSSVPLYVSMLGIPGMRNPFGRSPFMSLHDYDEDAAWDLLTMSLALPFFFGDLDARRDVMHHLPVSPLYSRGIRKILGVTPARSKRRSSSVFPGTDLFLIAPEAPLRGIPSGHFGLNEDTVKRWIDRGYEDTMKAMKEAPQWLKRLMDGPRKTEAIEQPSTTDDLTDTES